MASFSETARRLLSRRRRLAPMVLVLAAVVVGGVVFRAYPREVKLRYALGPDHAAVTDLWLSYEHEGEAVRGVHFSYPEGAPEHVYHAVELSEGRYTVRAELRGEHLSRDVSRAFRAPAEGRIRVRLYDPAEAVAVRP